MTGAEHQPVRPSWKCGTCGHAWPCEPAREALAAEHESCPAALAVYMVSLLSHAVTDLPGASVAELYARFVVWTRPVPLDAS